LDSIEVKESDCNRYRWFGRAIEKEKNNISINKIKEEKESRFRSGGNRPLNSIV